MLRNAKTDFLRCISYPKLHKRPYKARFIANSSSCTTTELSKLLTSCLTTVKNHVIRYCEKVYERSGKNLFWSIKNSGEVLNKLKSRGFRATSLNHRGSTVGFRLLQCSSGVVRHPKDLQVSVATHFCRVLIFASSQYRRLSLTRLCLSRYYHLRRSDSPVPTFFPIYLLQFDYASLVLRLTWNYW